MKAKYDFLTVPDRKEGAQAQMMYPKLVSNGTVSWDKMVREISQHTCFDRGAVIGVMEAIEERMLYYLQHGYRVQIGRIGSASVGLKMKRQIDNETEIHAQSIQFDKVKFQVSRSFRCYGKVERADCYHKFGKSHSPQTEEQRFTLLEAYLKENGFISRIRYCELTGLMRTKAQEELNRWINEKRLEWEGKGSHKVYCLRKK